MGRAKRAPRNTAADMHNPAHVMGTLAVAMTVGTTRMIEDQEAQGQRSFVGSDTLPTRLGARGTAVLEAAGVRFLGQVPDDPLFQYVELPTGWQKTPTDHSMWSDLRDAQGRIRARIFYKAAFYDRDAHLVLVTRYSIRYDYDEQVRGNAVCRVLDGSRVLYTAGPYPLVGKEYGTRWQRTVDRVQREAERWLAKHFRDHADPSAYWD